MGENFPGRSLEWTRKKVIGYVLVAIIGTAGLFSFIAWGPINSLSLVKPDEQTPTCSIQGQGSINLTVAADFHVTLWNDSGIIDNRNASYHAIMISIMGSMVESEVIQAMRRMSDPEFDNWTKQRYGPNFNFGPMINFVTLTSNGTVLIPIVLTTQQYELYSIDGRYTRYVVPANFSQIMAGMFIGIDMDIPVYDNDYYMAQIQFLPIFGLEISTINQMVRQISDRYICAGENITISLSSARFYVGTKNEWGSYETYPEISQITLQYDGIEEIYNFDVGGAGGP